MRSPRPSMLAMCISVLMVSHVAAQDLGPNFRKLTEGIYVYVGNDRPNDLGPESNIGIVLTQEGVVLIDTGQNVMAARAVQAPSRNSRRSRSAMSSPPRRMRIITPAISSFLLRASALPMKEPPGAERLRGR